MKNRSIKKDPLLSGRKQIATDLASKIETTLKSFNIKSRVEEVTFEKRYVLLKLVIAEGVIFEGKCQMITDTRNLKTQAGLEEDDMQI